EELSLGYIARLKNSENNPATLAMEERQEPSEDYSGRRASVPLYQRMVSNLKTQEIERATFPALPPWTSSEIKTCKTSIHKKTMLPEEMKASFSKHLNEHTSKGH
ncbi:hypothetical protein, partial [Klebsiella pneumoniae]|uniref:hypothetical protein n=1 Tax=Klebsiella pneumoniae TaxID=573 RepID=UPI003EB91BC1